MIAATGLTPLHVVVQSVETLPRLASGKIDYAAVKELRAAEEPKRNESVVEAFRRAFYPRRVAPSDSFGSLGGSLASLRAAFAGAGTHARQDT